MTPDARFDPPAPDTSAQKKLRAAFEALETGSADRAQGRLIIAHFAAVTGYYNGMSLTAWMKDTGSAAGFEIACVEHQAKRWVFSQVLPYLTEHPDGRGND